jgi:glycosyltransferase involved in cell wall biosynthesis
MTIHLSILVPVFNEQESLGAFLEAIQAPLEQALALIAPDAQAELLFVDDGSTDRTPDMLAILCGLDSRVRSMRLSRNFGKEAALAAGLHHARGLAVVPMDVDLQDPPEVLPQLVREWCNGARVVNAKRVDRSCDGVFKRWSANGFYRLFNILSEMELPENVGDFRLLDRVAVDVMNRLGERSRFSKGCLPGWASRWPRWNTPGRARNRAHQMAAAPPVEPCSRRHHRQHHRPLRIWTYVGSITAMAAFAYAAFLILHADHRH